ncbi:MAG: AAA family ATPase [Verrucomicrobia bacterium]|nr:AAA family ATPase [Verrucomicrobiota bacterium]
MTDLNECRRRLPLPELMGRLALGDNAKKSARCPWPQNHTHEDRNPSFGIYQNGDGWRWKCFVCGNGDEVTFLEKHFGISTKEAIGRYGKLAGVDGKAGSLPATKQVTPEQPTPKEKTERDLGDLWRNCVEGFTVEHRQKLAEWRGYSVEFCEWLQQQELVGLFNGNTAFPVHDEKGRVVGIHYQVEPQNGGERAKWRYEGGCNARPLVIGNAKTAASVIAFESQWDAFAVMDKQSWHKAVPEVEAAIITRGCSNGELVAGLCAQDATLFAFKQNDGADDARKAGKWLADVSANAGCKVMLVTTPEQHKDANDWTRAGATTAEIGKAVVAATVVSAAPAPLAGADLKGGMDGSLVDGAALQAMTVEPREFIVRPFFKVGDLGFIFAKRGDGKTWLTMLLAKTATTAGTAGPWQAEKPCAVLYVDGEMPAEETKRRDKALGTTTERLVFLHHEIYFEQTGRTLNLADPLQQDAVTRLLAEHGFRVLVLDNLSCLFAGMRENEADSWELVLPWLLRLRRMKIAVVIVAHAGRNGNMRGTSRREDQAFWVIKLERSNGDGTRGLKFTSLFTKNRNALEDDCLPLEWTITEEADGTAMVSAKPISGVELLVNWVNEGLDSAGDIAQEMGISKGQVSKLAKKAEAAGRITIKGRRYRPAEGGGNV